MKTFWITKDKMYIYNPEYLKTIPPTQGKDYMKTKLLIVLAVVIALFFIVRIVQHTCAEITQVYKDVKVNAMKLNYPIKYMDEFQHDLPGMDFETFKARYGSVLDFERRGLLDAQRFLNKLESQQQKE